MHPRPGHCQRLTKVYLKEGYSDAFLEQCRRMVCGGKDRTTNYVSCLMSLTLSDWAGQDVIYVSITTGQLGKYLTPSQYPRQRQEDFSSNFRVQTSSEAHPASCLEGTGGPFPGGKVRPGLGAHQSLPSNSEVLNE
jgi:hypothetical protein